MRIRAIEIQNFRLFPWDKTFTLDNINIPNGSAGSGLTVFVGENASGKTSLLDAIALPLLTYKAESFKLSDFHNPKHKVYIRILSDSNFEFDGTMPKAKYKAKGFQFEAGLRSRGNKSYLSSLVVQDQKFIRADGEDKPDDTSPDLRVNVNNPFKGTRFNENDILFLDRNRTFQTRSSLQRRR